MAVAGDYDGDGWYDQAVYDPNRGTWFIRSLKGTVLAWDLSWGAAGMTPVSGDFNGDGASDLALWNQNGQKMRN